MAAVNVAPSSLAEVCDLESGVSYPGAAIRGHETALCLFCAAWHGRQDAYWLADAGLRTTCVDFDEGRLREMHDIYPDDWEFLVGDAFDTKHWRNMQWDVVSLDPFSNLFDRCAENLPLWCSLANHVVILGMDDRPLEAPDGWRITDRRKRSDYLGGVYWVVLERA